MGTAGFMFDLDGTLADTLRDIAEAANHALRALGHSPRPVPEYRYLAGQGLPYLIRHALGSEDQTLIERGIAHFHEYYAEHKYDHTGPFEGLPEALDTLVQRGHPLAVLSNKPHDATRKIVAHLFSRWQWQAVRGHTPGGPLKPDPAGALAIAQELDIPPSRWVYVGDTKADMLTARAAGMTAVGVTWGFRDEPELRENGAEIIIHHPRELVDVPVPAEGQMTNDK